MRMSLRQKNEFRTARTRRPPGPSERTRDDLKSSRSHKRRGAPERKRTQEPRADGEIRESRENVTNYLRHIPHHPVGHTGLFAFGIGERVDWKNLVITGTDTVAPLWAGLIASLNQQLKRGAKRPGYPSPNRLVASTGVEITRLLEVPDEDRRPDARAHASAHRLLIRLSDLGFEVSASDVYLDPDRAIRLLWRSGFRNVELVFPSSEDEDPYLYYSDEQQYGVEENPSAESLLVWLKWALKDMPGGRPCAA
jgi:hypothetical protein